MSTAVQSTERVNDNGRVSSIYLEKRLAFLKGSCEEGCEYFLMLKFKVQTEMRTRQSTSCGLKPTTSLEWV